MKIPLVDLKASFAPIREDLFREFERIFEDMNLFLGRNVQEFEEE